METSIRPDDRIRIGGHAAALYGRTGTVVGRSELYALAALPGDESWVVTLDPSTDVLPGDYYPRGGAVTVAARALVVLRDGQWWSQPYMGTCDGCESQALQRVRDVSGEWGTATVCPHHEDHE